MLGMSNCAHAQEYKMCIIQGHWWRWRTELGGCFSAMEDEEDSVAGPSQRTYLAESSAETSAECSLWLATLTKKKAKRWDHCRSQESKKRTTKSSKVESTFWRVSTSQVLFFWLPLNQQCKISDNCSAHPTCMRDAQCEALYACAMRIPT